MLAPKKQQIHDALLGSTERRDNRGGPLVDTGPPANQPENGYHQPQGDPGGVFEGGSPRDAQTKSGRDIKCQAVEMIGGKFKSVFQTSYGEFMDNENKLTVSEPRNLKGRLTALFQNMFEVLAVLTVIIIARTKPSYVSFSISIVTYLSLIPTLMGNKRRISLGMIFSIVNLAITGLAIVAKIKYAPRKEIIDKWSKNIKSNDICQGVANDQCTEIRRCKDYGYVITREESTGQFTFDLKASLRFEIAALIVYTISLIFFLLMQIRISALRTGKNKVLGLFLQHWTVAKTIQEEEEENLVDEQEGANIDPYSKGKPAGGLNDKESKKLRQTLLGFYRHDINKQTQKVSRCYIDCYYFSKLNKTLFAFTFIFTMIQTMAFNCLIELPLLFMMLGFFSMYSERKRMFLTFSYYILVFMILLCLCLFITLSFGTFIHINSPMQWYIDKFESDQVQLLRTFFGERVKFKISHADELDVAKQSQEDLKSLNNVTLNQEDKWIHRISYIVSFICSHAWMIAKFSSIREQTSYLKDGSAHIFRRWNFAHGFKGTFVTSKQGFEFIVKALRSEGGKGHKGADGAAGGGLDQVENFVKTFDLKKLSKIGKQDLISRLKKDFIYFIPSVNIWLLRFGFGFQAYLYHGNIGLFHLAFVLATFFCQRKFSYFLTIFIMLPVYTIEFIVIYGLGIPGFENIKMFTKAQVLTPVSRNEMLIHGSMLWEQTLYFFNLSMLFLALGSYKIVYQLQQKEYLDAKAKGLKTREPQTTEDGSDTLTLYFKRKMSAKDSSTLWKVSFYVLRYVHVIMLFTLLCQAAPNLNRLRALGFLMMFAFWTISETFYRRTVKILIFFMSFFIICQYYFSLTYHRYDDQYLNQLQFYNMVEREKMNKWNYEDSIYFRFTPYSFDWIILIMTSGLVSINKIFQNEEARSMQEKIFTELEQRHQKVVYWFMLAQIKLRGLLVYFLMIVMFFYLGKVQTNVINIVFFTLIMTLIMVASKNDRKNSTLKWSKFLSQSILTYSMIVIIGEFIFSISIGYRANKRADSIDQQFKQKNPGLYEYLAFIGFRMAENRIELPIADVEYKKYFRLKFTSYIIFLLTSKYCLMHYEELVRNMKHKSDMGELAWTKLLEYRYPSMENTKEKKQEKVNETGTGDQASWLRRTMMQSKIEDMQDDFLTRNVEHKETNQLLRYWINIQDDPAYSAYKLLNWWPYLDTLTTYSHLFTNFIIIYIAIWVKVTVYSMFLLATISLFYIMVSMRISKSSMEIYRESGLLEQTELKIAGLIAKKYAQKTSREFLQLRSRFWKIQSIIYVIIISISFCTTLSYRYRDLLNYKYQVMGDDSSIAKEKAELFAKIKSADTMQFWLFFLGLYKDHRTKEQNYFYIPFAAIGFAYIVERQAINWLYNRQGCSFNWFQKITELEVRVKLIEQGLEAPPYDPSRYKNHYFYNDFDMLRERMTTDPETTKKKVKKAKKKMTENLDFIPFKIAKRLKETIMFTVLLDSKSKDVNGGSELDQQTLDMLDRYERECNRHGHFIPMKDFEYDYESYPILRNHKINLVEMMLKSFIDRKYKISFMKGMMLLMEQSVLLITVITMIIKANMYSFIYFIFVIKYFKSQSKVFLLVRMNYYIALIFIIQYATFLFNLTSGTSPQPFPKLLDNYPHLYDNEDATKIPFAVPFFYKYKPFRDLNLSYFLGVGVQSHQIEVLILDFVNLAVISMYVFNFRNPLLFRSMRKVFWSYPNEYDAVDKWKRLEPNVLKQNKWFQRPYDITHQKFNKIDFTDEDKRLSYFLKNFALQYQNQHDNDGEDDEKEIDDIMEGLESNNKEQDHHDSHIQDQNRSPNKSFHDYSFTNDDDESEGHHHGTKESHGRGHESETVYDQVDLNYMLVNWLELKYDKVWSNDLMREKKWELKEQSFYFRAVKQGSVLIYLSFHIFLIFVIMVMSTIRRSILSFGYIVILIPHMKDGSEVLGQRDSNQGKLRQKASDKVSALREQLKKETNTGQNAQEQSNVDNDSKVSLNIDKKKKSMARIVQLGQQIQEAEAQLRKLEQKRGPKTKLQQLKERSKDVSSQWIMIDIVKKSLLTFSSIDLLMQIFVQMPFVYNNYFEQQLGIRKVWIHPFSEDNSAKAELFRYDYAINKGHQDLFTGLTLDVYNFQMQIAIAVMICLISLQAEIFDSEGYKKYVTQTDGSMDLIIQLATLKQKSLTYVYNNLKIQKILKNQTKREVILNTVDKIKEKLIRWRKFQKTTLDVVEGKKVTAAPQVPRTKSIQASREPNSVQQTPRAQEIQMSQRKQVQFSGKDDVVQQPEEEKNGLLDMEQEHNKRKALPPELVDELVDKLATQFVKSKENKLGRCARYYLCLQRSCVTQILFKNQKKDLEHIVELQAMGKMTIIPCELEKVMINETKEIIRNKYDHKDGVTQLWKLLNTTKGKSSESILQMTQLDQKIKLTQMTNTWRFTRNSSLFFKYLETFFYALISNTDNIVYLSMMGSMYQSAGLVSLIYPISIFGYALLEETRPRQKFWNLIRNYTIVMLSIKFFINLKALDIVTNSEMFEHWNGILMIGLRKQNGSVTSILFYLLPEMMIITFIMLNQVKLKLIGLFEKQEEEFENIKEGIQRYIYQGDIEKVQEDKIKRTYMDMEKHFRSYNDQSEDNKDMLKEKEKEDKLKAADMVKMIQEAQMGDDSDDEKEQELTLEQKQEQLLSGISRAIFLCATEFDIDETGDIISDLDRKVKSKLIKKGLENDTLYYIEGAKQNNNPEFINEEKFEQELIRINTKERALSSGDFKLEVEAIQDLLDHKNEETKIGMFERNPYLKRIFPASIEQKPGVDYYGTTTLMLFIIAIYVCNKFDKLFVTPEDLLQGAKGSNNIFSGKLSLILLFISIVIVIERFISRADVKVRLKQTNLESEEKSFFNKQQQFARSTTQRSMTVKLKTMKTTDLDMTGTESQEFLSSLAEQKDTRGPSTNVTKVSKQQKLKFYLHWLILIGSHIFIFYYIPMVGNIELYGWSKGPKCNDDNQEEFKYGCKNFHSMRQSMIFYTLICIYLNVSAKQMRKGLPTFKIASSVLGDYEWYHGVRAQIYMMIPFAAELRCLIDFTFTKTALDIFQYWQLFNYHIELFICKCGNDSYVQKVFGAKVLFEDNIIGYAVLFLLLVILIGPIVFFSEYAFIQANPVKDAEISISLVISKSLTKADLKKRSVWKEEANENIVQNIGGISDKEFQDSLANNSLHLFDMAYENSYIRHQDEEIDYDIIFGRKDHRSRPVTNKKNQKSTNFGIFNQESVQLNVDEGKLRTEVPFLLFSVRDPNMRTIDEPYRKAMQYSNWTETKFFKAEQIQEVISTEYPDHAWAIDSFNRKYLMDDIRNSFKAKLDKKEGFDLLLLIETKFTRNNPTDTKVAVGKQNMSLILDRLDDCTTMEQLKAFSNLDCSADKTGSAQILFQQAYQPLLILGATKDVFPIERKISNPDYQKYDILMEFRCPDMWLVRSSSKNANATEGDLRKQTVDPQNKCEPENTGDDSDKQNLVKLNEERANWMKRSLYTRFNFTLFSMFVSGSFLAGFSVKTFYLAVAYGLSGTVRVSFIFGTWKGFIYEITDPMAIIKVMEACYMYRFEQDLYNEEETYRIVQEIVRSPDLMKALTGSSLRGQLDPMLDKFTEEDKKKYRHLERLEARDKFDVTKLKEAIINKYKTD